MSVISYTDLKNVLEAYQDTEITPIKNRVTALENASPTPTPTPSTTLWGIKIDRNDSNPATRVSYINDNANYTPVSYDNQGNFQWGDWKAFFDTFFTPVMLNSDGTEAYELNHNDQTKKLDGVTASDIDDPTFDGNAMLRIKKLWYHFYLDGDYECYEFASYRATNDFCCDCFIDKDGNVKEQAYVGLFMGYTNGPIDGTNKMRSLKYGTVKGCSSYSNTIASAQQNGSNWGINTYTLYTLLAMLHMMLGKNTNTQEVFGNGKITGTQTFSQTETSGLYTNTDTSVASGPFACASLSSGNAHVKTFYIHDFWGGIAEMLDGIQWSGTNQTTYIKTHPPFTDVATNADASFAGYFQGGSFPEKIRFSDNIMFIAERGGSSTTYYPDWFHTQAASYSLSGGRFSGGTRNGLPSNELGGGGALCIFAIHDGDIMYYSPRLMYV